MLCNALIEPYFDYVCLVWYPNLIENTKKKVQIMHSKCIYFSLRLDKMHHIPLTELISINWLATKETFTNV